MIAATLEEQLKKLDQALEQYRKVTWGRFQNPAQQRISRLTAKSLKVVTERVFRTDETPWLRLETRNIEAVKVQVYQVDLETYFRKMHLAVGIEKLDIALIDPDHSFEYKIPDYSAYQQFTQQVEVPLPTSQDAGPAAGVMAVTVSSKTLESTTLIVRSDLDVIAKSSRDEIFLFVQNMRTGEPCPQAQVLVSNGDQVFADGKTNDDGIYRHTYEQLKSANDVRVFVVADEHVAFNNVGLDGIGVAQGLTDKGYIFTDRPAYRPGQMVHVRGILRKADKDVYTIATGKKYQVSVYDNRSRIVHETEVELSDLGSFHANFPLPAACPQGEYRILVQDVDKENYQGSFVVHDYQLEPVRIEVTSPRTVYYRGEELEGKIKVSYYYGAPLAEREVRYQLAGGRMYTAKTDQDGQIEFNLPTRDFRESQPLPLVVFLPERNLQAGKTFYLATQAFTLSADTVRDVFLAGETFELKVDAKDAEGEPLAVPLELRVLKRTTVAGRTGEVSVQQHVIKTDEEGTARHTLKLADGGQYVLRAEGTDRFGNPVSTENVVTISDEKDAVRLRILSSKHTYRVGDTATVQVHWREDPATALVTYQGARILEYRLVQLNQGANKLEIPMAAMLAPNFDLAVAVMTDVRDKKRNGEPARRFHEASSPFTVQRQLNVIVDWEGKGQEAARHQPGDKLDVTIKTTDPQGKPISAEVSLAMIERALLDQFPTSVSAVQKFFRNVPRQSMMRTVSSITFDYKPSTKAINPRLLAEADRLAIAEEETRRLTALAASNESLDLRERFLAESSAPVTGGTTLRFESGAATNYDNGRPATAWGGSQSGVNNWSALQSQRQSLQQQQTANLADFGQIDETLGAQLPQLNDPSPQPTPVFSFFYSIPNRDLAWRNVELQWADGNFDAQAGDFGYQVLTKNGTLFNVTLDHKNRAEHDQLAQALIDEGAIVIPQMRPDETGYWNPAIRTDEQGVAKVSITLPNRSTAWTLAAKGITADTLAGETEESLKCQKDLFGQLKLPAALTDNDTAELQATIHNDLLDKGEVTVELRTTIGGKSVSERKTVQFEKKGIQEVSFTQTLRLPEADRITGAPEMEAVFELVVQSGDVRDTVRRSVPIRPYGTPVYAIKGGSADSDVTAVVEAPPEMPLTAPRLQVIVGPTVQRSLVDVLFASPTWCQRYANRITASSDATVSDLLAALALQGLLGKTREASSPETEDIDRRIRSAISLLISTQNDDGGWSWSGRAGTSDRYYSSRVVWRLVWRVVLDIRWPTKVTTRHWISCETNWPLRP